jgi:serine/threonine-protein kinase PknK
MLMKIWRQSTGATVVDDSLATQFDVQCNDVGTKIGIELAALGFEQANEVGRGGFGVVYRCRQMAPERLVAVKVLTAARDDDLARFVREEKATARLTSHPNIVPVLQIGETASGYPFLVMPFCGQGSIQQRIGRLGVLEVGEVLRLGVKLAGALASAHQVQIVHRDVKPANILYTDYGEPALCDFGIARTSGGGFRTATGVFAGSPAFTAPELISGEEPRAASDVYGLGATLFASLTGHAAFERRAGENVIGQFRRISTEPVPDLSRQGIPRQVAALVNTAMAHDPADRPSAAGLGELIKRVQAQLGMPVTEMALHNDHEAGRRPARSAVSVSAPVGRGVGGRLPAKVASFVGREAEVAQLHEILAASRMVTLIGIGGVGKTTLAAHAAEKFRPQFDDGVWWAELAELREGGLLTEVVAAALGVRDQKGRSLTDVLVDFLEPRQTLLVLDNCEHLIDDVAKLAEILLRDCPQLQILATSREVLSIAGEALVRLPPLSCPTLDDEATLHAVSGYAAVQLFVERARAAAPGFALDTHNASAIAGICARLEGLPLAIEMAAARMRAMSPEDIAEGLSDRFALLSHGRRGTPTRRQSLTACVDWSYELCTQAEQELWCRLSVLAESFDLPTARGICGEGTSASIFLDMLCSLVDKSIVIRTERQGVVCFGLLETLRDYAKNRISDTERLRLARCHAHWYHRLLIDAEAQWFGTQQLQWVQRLTRELPNIREALQFSLTDCPTLAVDMTAALREFWVYHAVLSEGCQWASRALGAIEPEPSVQRVRALYTAAHLATRRGDVEKSLGWLAEARSLLEVVEEPVTRGRISFSQGYVAVLTGDIERARELLQEAIAATDDFETQVHSMSGMCWVDVISGDAHAGLGWAEKCHALAESRGDWSLRAVALGTLGVAHWQLGELERADQEVRQRVQLALEVNDTYALSNGLEVLAWITESRQQPRHAVVLMAAAAEISRASGEPLVSSFIAGFHTDCERRAREELSAKEFQQAWDEGTALTMSDIAQAM